MKNIHIAETQCDPSRDEFEVVERKGIGHPDSIADIIAESFSNHYSNYCLENYGKVLNHWFDKVLISGGEAIINPGFFEQRKKPRVYLFGKITKIVDFEPILKKLFEDVVQDTFRRIFGISRELMPQIQIDTNSGVGTDHTENYYTLSKYNGDSYKDIISNDTVFCNGYYNYSKLERFVVDLENYINSVEFKIKFSQTGFDVKILAKRQFNNVNMTICIPFLAEKTESWNVYSEIKNLIKNDLDIFCKKYGWDSVKIYLNTKDVEDRGYLTVFGSALDKGDFGVVGRGNRYSGFISANRAETQEAYSGKNPITHSGKIYTVLCHRIARRIFSVTGVPTKILVSINNGTSMFNPDDIHIYFDSKVNTPKPIINQIVIEEIDDIPELSKQIISKDPIFEFRERTILNINKEI